MTILFVEYPTCSTCIKAKKFLKSQGLEVVPRHIVEDTPTKEELSIWWKRSNLDIKKFFNTSGNVYKDLHLKDKLKDMSIDEQLTLLSSNGMLIKRPIVVTDKQVLVGFQEENYKKICPEC